MTMPTAPTKTEEFSQHEIEQLFVENYDSLYQTAYRVIGNHHDAENVVQTLFLKLVDSKFPPGMRVNPKAYLRRAAVNEALNTMRSMERRKEDHGVEAMEIPAPEAGRVWDNVKDTLQDAFASLKPEAVEILVLRYEHGYSDAEIATMLGQSRSKIAMILNRSRAKLQEFMRRGDQKKEK